ncbi:MAG: hypothetical protein ACFFCS_08910 [Candidatus Hodarchaeota archaeon]
MIKKDFEIKPDDKAFKRLLGKRAERIMKSKRSLDMYEEAKEDLANLVKPAVGWNIFEIHAFSDDNITLKEGKKLGTGFFVKAIANASHLLVAVCTIGPDVEKKAKEYMNNNDTFKGYLLDSMASWAVGNLKDQFLDWVTFESPLDEFNTSFPYSPGMGKWPMEDQVVVFELLQEEASQAGVRLTDSLLMVPIKSQSLVMGLGKGQIGKIR